MLLLVLALNLISVGLSVHGEAVATIDAIQVTSANIDGLKANFAVLLLNFYADWCHFSRLLSPIWTELAKEAGTKFEQGQVAVGRIDCQDQADLASTYGINKYPTIKIVVHGRIMKKEYRGKRDVNSLLDFITGLLVPKTRQISIGVSPIPTAPEVIILSDNIRHVVGKFAKADSQEFQQFERAASVHGLEGSLCQFHHDFDSSLKQAEVQIKHDKSDQSSKSSQFSVFRQQLSNFDEFSAWLTTFCTPIVREITFDNAEELTEEGKPFVILFYDPGNVKAKQEYSEWISKHFMHELKEFNFLTADGDMFAHPLLHLGKTKKDLPLIAMDSFRHMYLYKHRMGDITKFAHYLDGYRTGRLHREFHFGPEEEETDSPVDPSAPSGGRDGVSKDVMTEAPESQFKNLKPDTMRYTLLEHEEL